MAQFANETVYSVDFTDVIDGAPSYSPIAGVVSLDISGPTNDQLDTTAHGDAWRERLAGLKDGGTLSMTLRFVTTVHVELLEQVGTLCAHLVEFPKACGVAGVPMSIESDGIITSVGVAAPHDGLFEATVSIQLTGEPDITEETGVCSVTINQASQSLAHPDTLALTAAVVTTGGASAAITWTSSNAAAATVVEATGVVTTVAAGVTTITATSTFDGTITGTVVITVTE